MKRMFRRVAFVLFVAALAAAAVLYLQRSEISAARNTGLAQTPGMLLAVEKGCNACHSLDGSAGIGPTWKGSYGTPRIMTDGSRRVVDDGYIRQSIVAPAAEVVMGFQNIMLPAELSDAEISQLTLLIRELGNPVSE